MRRCVKPFSRTLPNIYELVKQPLGDGTLLRRPFAEICVERPRLHRRRIRRWIFMGCGALHLLRAPSCRGALHRLRPEAKSHGVGGELLHSLLGEAEDHGVGCVCLFTRIPDFFFATGFREVEDRTALPDKIFKDCQILPASFISATKSAYGPWPGPQGLHPRTPDRSRATPSA